MNEYDISSIFKEMEDYLLSSMSRNMRKHTNWENDEGFQWEMWQAKQLEALNDYRRQNKKYVNEQSSFIREKIKELLRQSNEHGGMQQEIKILEAIKKGFKPGRTPKGIQGSFFKLNERKLNALIKAVDSDMKKATTAMLRMTNDEYRKTIYKAQVFANTGTMTTDQAIDMATKDFLSKGINCIEYKDGNRVNIASYAEMAIRTANKRAYLQGEGAKRDEWGIHTVLVSRYGACSPTCLPWQGKVYIDDVYSGGTAEEAEKLGYPLLSTAIAGGLFHPNCKHTMSTYFEGISTVPTVFDVKGTQENSNLIATQRYNERQIRKYKRLEKNSLDESNKAKYATLRKQWQAKQRKLIGAHPEMHRNYKREGLRGVNMVDTIAEELLSKAQTLGRPILESDKLSIPFKNKSGKIINSEKEVTEALSNIHIKTKNKNIIELVSEDMKRIPKCDLEFVKNSKDTIILREAKGVSNRYGKIRNALGKTSHIIEIDSNEKIGTFAHELAHYMAERTNIYSDEKFISIMYKSMENAKVNPKSIRGKEYMFVDSDKFINEYQGRTYVTPSQFKKIGFFKESDMKEYISVAYEYFVKDPDSLYKKDKELYNFIIKGGVSNGHKR